MKRFMQENYALVVGITLPLALMILFFIAGRTAEVTVGDPEYDLVYVTNYYDDRVNQPFDIKISDSSLVIEALEKDPQRDPQYHYNPPQIYVFDHATKTSRRINVDFSKVAEGRISSADLDALNRNRLSDSPLSPDGYTFEYNYRSSGGGIAGEFFGFGRRYGSEYGITKKPRSIPVTADQPLYQAKFLAWVAGPKQ